VHHLITIFIISYYYCTKYCEMDRHTDIFFTDEDIARYADERNILGSSTTDIESFNISNATTFYILPSAEQYKRLREDEERNELERSRLEGSEPCVTLPYVYDDSSTAKQDNVDTNTKLCNGMHHDEHAEKTDSIANQKTDNKTNNDKDDDQGDEVMPPPNQSEPLLEAQTEEQKSESLLETEKSETLLDSSPELDRTGKQLIETTENDQSESLNGIEKGEPIGDQRDDNEKQSEPIIETDKQSESTLQSEVDKQVHAEPLVETETKQSETLLGETETDEPDETEKQPAEQSIDKEKNKKLIKLGEDKEGSDELITTSDEDEMNDSPNKDRKTSCIRKVKQSSDTDSDDQSEAKRDDITQPHKTTVKDNYSDSESEGEDGESDELISSDDSANLKKNKRGIITSRKQRRPQNKKAMEPASSNADESEIEEANIRSHSRKASTVDKKKSCSDLYSDQSSKDEDGDDSSLSDELISSSDDESDSIVVNERRNMQVTFKSEAKLPIKTTKPSKPRGRSPIKAKSDDSGWITRQTEIDASQTRIKRKRQKSLMKPSKRRRITSQATADSPESIGGGDMQYRRPTLRFAAAPVANNKKKKQVSLTTMFAKAKNK